MPISFKHFAQLSPAQREQVMYRIFLKIKKRVDHCFVFGPCNSNTVNRVDARFSRFFVPTHSEQKCLGAILAKRAMFKEGMAHLQEDMAIDEKIKRLAIEGYRFATGTCMHYAIIGAIYLIRDYNLDISIEHIHSELTHTYLKVHTDSADYIFDFWSGILVQHGNWSEWNEAVDYEFRFQSSANFSLLADKIPHHLLQEISQQLTNYEQQRTVHIQAIEAQLAQVPSRHDGGAQEQRKRQRVTNTI